MVMTHGLVALLIVLIVIVGSILTHRCEEFMIGGSLVGAAVLFKGSFLTQWCTMLQGDDFGKCLDRCSMRIVRQPDRLTSDSKGKLWFF